MRKLSLLFVVCLVAVRITAAVQSVNMNEARVHHAAVTLATGEVVVIGGDGEGLILDSAETWSPQDRKFVMGARMKTARADLTATRLKSGLVLIAGGRGTSGALRTTEFFDGRSFWGGPELQRARSRHTATPLADGRVLLIGGDDEGTFEIVDAVRGTSSLLPFRLAEARSGHSSILLEGSTVLIAGGVSGGKAMRTAEIFDLSSGAISPPLLMNEERVQPLLRKLPNGVVQAIGGNDRGSMELFNPARKAFTANVRLDQNPDRVDALIGSPARKALMGSTRTRKWSEAAIGSAVAEGRRIPLYDPQLDRVDFNVAESGDWAVVTGGRNANGLVLRSAAVASASSATVTTDKADYPPNSVVTISGSGWFPGERVRIVVSPMKPVHPDHETTVTADANGNFTDTSFSTTTADISVTLLVVATGEESNYTAETSFSDLDWTYIVLYHYPNPSMNYEYVSLSAFVGNASGQGVADGVVYFWRITNGSYFLIDVRGSGDGWYYTNAVLPLGTTIVQANFSPNIHDDQWCCGFLCLSTCGYHGPYFTASETQESHTVCAPPAITAPPDITINTPANATSCSTPVSVGSPSVTGCNASISSSGIPAGSIFPVGTTTITWTVNAIGGSASATQRITVRDATPPKVTLNGASTLTTGCHSPISDPLISATDNCTSVPVIFASGTVNFDVPGTYTRTYFARDAAGNVSDTLTRTFVVRDNELPLVTLNGPGFVTLECHQPYTDAGATAFDACAGTLAVTPSGSVNVNSPGLYFITWRATDPSGNSNVATRTINVIDSTPPQVTLNGPSMVEVECHTPYVEAGATATDACSVVGPISILGTVDVNTPGTYTLTYRAIDGVGNTGTATRTVKVVDRTPPVVTLTGPDNMVLECHQPFVDPGASASDSCAGTLPVSVSGTFDPNTPGTYTLKYTSTDPAGNQSLAATRIVVVQDTTLPMLTLNGAAEITHECHTPYVDPGATATDGCAGPLTPSVSGSVNVNVPGAYTLTYSVSDSSGNAATPVTRTVHVVDTTPPTVTLNGAADVTVECHGSYAEQGASAVDGCDSSVGATSISGSVDINTPGVYTLTYSATDAAGNSGSASRTVRVVDQTRPVVTLNGSANMAVECHQPFVDPGASASDSCAGELAVSVTGTVDPNTPGSYTLEYKATDPAGNQSLVVTRVVVVQDTTPPTISLNGAADVTHECHAPYADAGATASDGCAGSLTPSVSGSVNVNVPGTYTLTYSVSDPAGNAATSVTRTVHVVDTTPPTVTLNGAGDVTVECHGTYAEQGASAVDACDTTVGATSISGTVDVNTPGTYTLTYSATDASGNTGSASRTVHVVDKTPPQLTLRGAASVDVECHTSYADAGASATDACSGNLDSSVTVTGSVDINTPGTYTLTYAVSDAAGNAASTVSRTVIVRDTTPPVITLNGAADVTHECHTPYADQGATASDSCAGALTPSASGSVNPDVPGTYTITYSVADPSGNAAIALTRTIHVVDTTPPVVTLNGGDMTVELFSAFSDPGATAFDSCAGSLAVTVSGSVDSNAVGTYVLVYSASDAAGNSASAQRTVKVVDTTRPTISSITASPNVLWPPNHQMVNVTVNVVASEGVASIASVSSSEPDNGTGDGNMSPDWEITGPLTLRLRAERAGGGPGRTYTIVVAVRDPSGNTTFGTVTVIVPHNK